MITVSFKGNVFEAAEVHRLDPDEVSCVKQLLTKFEIPPEAYDQVRIAISGIPVTGDLNEPCIIPDHSIISLIVVPAIRNQAAGLALRGVGFALAVAALFPGPQQPFIAVAALAVNAFAAFAVLPPKPPKVKNDEYDTIYRISRVGNSLKPFQPIPKLFGRLAFEPPLAAQTYSVFSGDDQYLHMLLLLTSGLCDVEKIWIGETEHTVFPGVQIEFRRGWSQSQITDKGTIDLGVEGLPNEATFGDHYTVTDYAVLQPNQTITYNGLGSPDQLTSWDIDQFQAFKLFTKSAQDFSFDTHLVPGNWFYRETDDEVTRLGVVISAPYGIYHVQNVPAGKFKESNADLTITLINRDTGETYQTFGVSIKTIRNTTFEWNGEWYVPKARWRVGIIRTNTEGDNIRTFNEVHWVLLQTGKAGQPVPIGGYSYLALVLKASGVLGGGLDSIRVLASAISKDLVGDTWEYTKSVTCGAAFVEVLQDRHSSYKLPDESIHWESINQWVAFTKSRHWNFNAYVETRLSVAELLEQICSVGLATREFYNGLQGVKIHDKLPVVQALITPRNSWGFEIHTRWPRAPNIIRAAFLDQDKNWDPNEITVYANDDDVVTTEDVERLDWKGITWGPHAIALSKYHLLSSKYNREVLSFYQLTDWVILDRRSRIGISHPIIAVGLGYGRIRRILYNSDGESVAISIDTVIEVRDLITPITAAIQYVTGDNQTTTAYIPLALPGQLNLSEFYFELAQPEGITISEGDLVTIGESAYVTWDAEVFMIEPTEKGARISAYTYDERPLSYIDSFVPNYSSRIRRLVLPAPIIARVTADGTTLLNVNGVLTPQLRILLQEAPPEGAVTIIQVKLSGTTDGWTIKPHEQRGSREFLVQGITEGYFYDIQVFFKHALLKTVKYATISSFEVVGSLEPPLPVVGLSVSVRGGLATLRWRRHDEIDVLYGGTYIIRFSDMLSGANLNNSITLVPEGILAGSTNTVEVPGKPGTFFVQAVDGGGRKSEPATTVLEFDITLHTITSTSTINEDPLFLGTKTDVLVSNSALTLVGDPGEIVNFGVYEFEAVVDVTSIRPFRLTLNMDVEAFDSNLLWDSEDQVDSNELWDGDNTNIDMFDIVPFYRVSEDNINWSDWHDLLQAEVYGRYSQLKIEINSYSPDVNVLITHLGVTVKLV